MAKSSAAKKTSQKLTEVERWYATTNNDGEIHPACGHSGSRHFRYGYDDQGVEVKIIECPAIPPTKQVTVDEAVLAKGGKPSTDFERSLAAAQGVDEQAERKKLALVNFEKTPGNAVQLDIAITQLRPMRGNPRGDDLGDVSGLVKSMEMHGFIGTLFVRRLDMDDANGEIFEVWAGNRRLKAAKEAGLLAVPCDVYDLTEVQALELNMAEQINRDGYTPLQEGDACRRLMELSGYNEHQVAEKFGKSASWVTKRVQLCGIAPELRKALSKGELNVTVANAIAALPSQQAQVKAYDSLVQRPRYSVPENETAEDQVAWLRDTHGQPLRSATWKLTDAELVPEAGSCAACPHNSANEKMPGMFDNAKAAPTCLKVACFEDKQLAAWLAKTAKQKAAGAKVLSLNECKKLFARGNDLGSSSRYVEAETKPPKDKQGRTWAELVADVPEEHRPVLHLAQDNGGKLRQLYVLDKVMEAAATHLKARWAKAVVEEAQERTDPKKQAQAREEQEARMRVEQAQLFVIDSVLGAIAKKQASDSAPLPMLRFMASRLGERAVETFREVMGVKKFPKDWVEKGATPAELLSLLWLEDATDEFRSWGEYDERFLALAKTHGFDVKAMTEAQVATAKQEAEKAK